MPNLLEKRIGPAPVYVYVLGGGGVALGLYLMTKRSVAPPVDAGGSGPSLGQPWFQPSPALPGGDTPMVFNFANPTPTQAATSTPTTEPNPPATTTAIAPTPAPTTPSIPDTIKGAFGETIFRLGGDNGTDVRLKRTSTMDANGTFDVSLADTNTWQEFGNAKVDNKGNVYQGTNLAGSLNKTQFWQLLLDAVPQTFDPSKGAPNPASLTTPDHSYGQAIGSLNGLVPVRYTRSSNLDAGTNEFDVTLGDTVYWQDFGRGKVNLTTGEVTQGGTLIDRLNPTQISNLLAGHNLGGGPAQSWQQQEAQLGGSRTGVQFAPGVGVMGPGVGVY